MNSPALAPRVRNIGIDAFRYIAFIFVVVLHGFIRTDEEFHSSIWIFHTARFAVPFFFIASGYFLARSDPEFKSGLLRTLKRIAPIFIVWVLIYLTLFGHLDDLTRLDSFLHILATGGFAYHLWFLPALAVGTIMLLWLKSYGPKVLIGIGIFLYLTGMIFDQYHTVFGIPELPIRTRNGPFFSFAFVATGYLISKYKIELTIRHGIILAIFGLILQIIEALFLSHIAGSSFRSYDFFIGTFLYGVGIFFVALNLQPSKFINFLAKLGSLSLGIYCIHLGFIFWLEKSYDRTTLEGATIVVLVVIILSTISSLLLSKIPYFRKLVA